MFIPEKLIKAREEKGLSRTDFMFELEKFGFRVSMPTLHRWDKGESDPGANQVSKLAEFFEKPEQYFFG